MCRGGQVPPAAFLGRREAGRWLERGMKRVKQCLGALFSFSSIPKQQISPGFSRPSPFLLSSAVWCWTSLQPLLQQGGSSGFA